MSAIILLRLLLRFYQYLSKGDERIPTLYRFLKAKPYNFYGALTLFSTLLWIDFSTLWAIGLISYKLPLFLLSLAVSGSIITIVLEDENKSDS